MESEASVPRLPNGPYVVKVARNHYVFRVQVIINGEAHTLTAGVTIADLVSQLGLNQRRIAVELNREIIAREEYGSLVLADGDQVEIVHFVGGG
jgi:thiamine biosynthesis protein ThiS